MTALPCPGRVVAPGPMGRAGQGRAGRGGPRGSFKDAGGGFGADSSPLPCPARTLSPPLLSPPRALLRPPGVAQAAPPPRPTDQKNTKNLDAGGRLGRQRAGSPHRLRRCGWAGGNGPGLRCCEGGGEPGEQLRFVMKYLVLCKGIRASPCVYEGCFSQYCWLGTVRSSETRVPEASLKAPLGTEGTAQNDQGN